MSDYRILVGDCREMLRTLPERSVHCVVTSPPYYGLRSYLPARDPRKAREIGLESRPDCLAWARGEPPCAECYVCTIRVVFREVWRVLRDDGVLWLNLGDSYANDAKWGGYSGGKHAPGLHGATGIGPQRRATRMKAKDLIGVPWRVAFALQADGWTLRSDVVWAKGASFGPFNGSVMPESVQDRPTKAHEFLFMFTKRARYFYDAEAVREDAVHAGRVVRYDGSQKNTDHENRTYPGAKPRDIEVASGRNLRSVWTISPQPFPGSHFAVMPAALVEPCILAGTSERGCCPECGAPWARVVERYRTLDGDRVEDLPPMRNTDRARPSSAQGVGHYRTGSRMEFLGWRPTCEHERDPVPCTVLDPFAGSGTVGMVATGRGRRAILIDLNPKYADMMRDRCGPLLEAPTPEVA